MTLVPEKWQESLGRLRDEIGEAFDRWLSRWRHHERAGTRDAPAPVGVRGGLFPLEASSVFSVGPAVDLEETDHDVIVRADIPGMDHRDLQVEVSGRNLWLRGQKRQEHEEKRRDYHRLERRYGAFARAVPLPCEVEADRARSTYRNGVLTVTLPKSERARAHRVHVKVE